MDRCRHFFSFFAEIQKLAHFLRITTAHVRGKTVPARTVFSISLLTAKEPLSPWRYFFTLFNSLMIVS